MLSAVADADCGAQIRDKLCGAVGGVMCGKLVADSGIVCAESLWI